MPNVLESRLAGPVVITTANTTKLTCPSQHLYIVKQLIVCNTNGVDAWFSLAINGTAVTAANCFFFQCPIAAFDTLVHDTQIILASTETLQAISDRGAVNLTVVGWDHTLT